MGLNKIQKKQIVWVNILVLSFFILDRIFKKLVLSGIIKKIFFIDFSLSNNPNIAFSIPLKGIVLYILLSIIFYALVFNLIRTYQQKKIFKFFGFNLIFVGALSNLLDRLIYGSVIDYVSLLNLTVFNLADVMILSGVIIVMIKILKKQKTPAG